MDADRGQVQQLGQHLADGAFVGVAGPGGAGFGGGGERHPAQGGVVPLPAGGQRQVGHPLQVGRDEVFGQLGAQALTDGRQIAGGALAHEEGREEAFAVLLPGHHGGVAQARVLPGEGGDGQFHLGGFDAVAAHLDLGVGPAGVHERPVGQHHPEVPGVVQHPVLAREGMPDEALLGEVRAALVAVGQAGAAEVDGAAHPGGHRAHPGVQHMGLGAVDGASDRGQRGEGGGVPGHGEGGGHVGLRRPVLVLQHGSGQGGAQGADLPGDAQLLSRGHQHAQGAGVMPSVCAVSASCWSAT